MSPFTGTIPTGVHDGPDHPISGSLSDARRHDNHYSAVERGRQPKAQAPPALSRQYLPPPVAAVPPQAPAQTRGGRGPGRCEGRLARSPDAEPVVRQAHHALSHVEGRRSGPARVRRLTGQQGRRAHKGRGWTGLASRATCECCRSRARGSTGSPRPEPRRRAAPQSGSRPRPHGRRAPAGPDERAAQARCVRSLAKAPPGRK